MQYQYYAVQVRNGSESIVASRLKSLNEKNGSSLFGNVVIPLEQIKNIDVTECTISVKHHLLFQGYVFVELSQLTPELFQLIRSVSGAVYTVLPSPIETHEIAFMFEERVDITLESTKINQEIVEKMKELIELKKNSPHKKRLIMNGKCKRTFSFPEEAFINISNLIGLTIADLLTSPKKLFLGVLRFETEHF
ncbi:transcription termination/antitermination NusG family protein [Lysinibacillus sphaericus]|uniref:transcription termination/antitermination NusG family protein n=1 Tax=Lysinibacillus sphaericus TaxID=1421 RepID=UPI003F7B24C1